MISGVFALIIGGRFSYGRLPEASATVVFGVWFLSCLVLAVHRGPVLELSRSRRTSRHVTGLV
jgi:hypothetical protein